jgi:hypothetical protein
MTRNVSRPVHLADRKFNIYDCHGKQRLNPTFPDRRKAEAACQALNELYRFTKL